MRLPGLLVTFVAVAACSTGQVARQTPSVSVTQVEAAKTVHARSTSAVPVDYNIQITNPLEEDLTLTSLEVETVGDSGAYSMKRVRHTFSMIIKSRDTAVVPIRAWVVPLQQNERGDVTGMVNVRGVATFASSSGVLKSAFANRVQ